MACGTRLCYGDPEAMLREVSFGDFSLRKNARQKLTAKAEQRGREEQSGLVYEWVRVNRSLRKQSDDHTDICKVSSLHALR